MTDHERTRYERARRYGLPAYLAFKIASGRPLAVTTGDDLRRDRAKSSRVCDR